MKKAERSVCGYCHTITPTANHVVIGDLTLCTDGDDSCYGKFIRLQKAKNETLRALFIGGACEELNLACAEQVERASRLSTLKRLVEDLIRKVIDHADELRRKAKWFIHEIFASLRRAAELVGLRLPEEALA